jgi:histidinol dehydrogenase
LLELTERFDKVRLDSVRVTDKEVARAYDRVPRELVDSLRHAAKNIRHFHELQGRPPLWMREIVDGVRAGVKIVPLQKAGAYIPGGRASYPSTALMCCIPASVAGVDEIVCCTPPPVNPLTLVALDMAGADVICQVGGAQAIAAMALGTASVPKVDKIVGPGNVYVTAAKMLLREEAEIDFPAGPSEIAILADSGAVPEYVAADILAQAEHDPNAACALISLDPELPAKVGGHIESMLAASPRREILERALGNCGWILASDLEEGADIVNRLAPEHLSLQTREDALPLIRNAGSIFVGSCSAVACGDYATGTNHVLPTAGHSRMLSGLDVDHFRKRISVQQVDERGLRSIGPTVISLAEAEGLVQHAESVRLRMK